LIIIGQGNKQESHSKDSLLFDPKIQDLDTVSDSLVFFRRRHPLAKVGIYVGKFPHLAPRDAVFLSLCKTKCDMFIVLLQSDYSARLSREQNLLEHDAKERGFLVASLPVVDWVCMYDEDIADVAINKLEPSMIFHGLFNDDNELIKFQRDKLVEISHPFDKSNLPKKALSLKFFDLKIGD
jgi:bifunctional ADP-heptose synthase (sugar kinase/adenylyltransferase)